MVIEVTLCVCVCVCVCVCERERERERDLRRLSFLYIMKSTEVPTSPMLASRAQLVTCGIHTLVALNATKYVIMTEVSAFFSEL